MRKTIGREWPDEQRISVDPRVLKGLSKREQNFLIEIEESPSSVSSKKKKSNRKRKKIDRRAQRIRNTKIRILQEDCNPILCYYCEKILLPNEVTADHYIPVSKGGETTPQNIVLACDTCNQRKSDKFPAPNYMI